MECKTRASDKSKQTKQKHENIKAKNTKFNCPLWMSFFIQKYASNQINFGLREKYKARALERENKIIIKEKIRIIKFK